MNERGKNIDDYVHPDFDSLYEENTAKRGELAVLYEELEYINRVIIPSTQTSYLIKVGALRVEALQAQVDVMRTRRRIALLRSYLERGERVHAAVLNHRVDKEFREWDERLRREVSQIDQAKARFSSFAPSEDEGEVRSLYRLLARKLHPEINAEQSDEAKSLWPPVQTAYIWGDVFQMKSLLIMADDYPESYEMPNDMASMRKNNAALKGKITSMAAKIDNLKQHPAFEWKKVLDDPELLASEQNKLRDEIYRSRIQKTALQELLSSLEVKGVR